MLVCSIVIIGIMSLSFALAVFFVDKSLSIPKDGHFKVDGYFNNFQKVDLKLFDGEYPYFTYHTGATEEEANDYANNPQKYAAYEADIRIVNSSEYDISSIWTVLPGTSLYYESPPGQMVKPLSVSTGKRLWLDSWLNEGFTSLNKKKDGSYKLHVIVKTEGLSNDDINELLNEMKVYLQLGIGEQQLGFDVGIGRSITFDVPIYYKSNTQKY